MRVTPARRGAAPTAGHLRLTFHATGRGIPNDEVVWADVPEGLANDVTFRLDAWLAWLLPYAFECGEDLVLDGPVDANLLRNVHELMEVWSRWRPDKRPVRVQAEPADPSERKGSRTGLSFTAGVDSFYSLLHHDEMASLHPEWRLGLVDDLIYVDGYDIPLRHRAALDRKRVSLEEVAAEMGKNS